MAWKSPKQQPDLYFVKPENLHRSTDPNEDEPSHENKRNISQGHRIEENIHHWHDQKMKNVM
jgi:hypothetical protein